MRKLLSNWGVPVGLLAAWGIAAAFTLHALAGMREATLPVMTAPAVVITAGRPVHS